MDRERWREHILESMSSAPPPWPDAPPLPGPWQDLERSDALALLLDLTQTQLAEDAHPTCERHPVLGLRALPLPCHERHLLVEVLLRTEEGDGLLAFVYGDSGVTVLDYTSPPVHALNRTLGPPASTATGAEAYLYLFNNFLCGSEGAQRFRIIAAPADLPLLPPQVLGEYRELDATLRRVVTPPRLHAMGEGTQEGIPADQVPVGDEVPAWIAKAQVLYGDCLFEADYRIERTGEIEMIEDRHRMEHLPVRRERFMGPIRLP